MSAVEITVTADFRNDCIPSCLVGETKNMWVKPADGTLAASSPWWLRQPLRQLVHQDARVARMRAKLALAAWCTFADIRFMARALAHRPFGGERPENCWTCRCAISQRS